MELYERRPSFQGVKFDGTTTSIDEMQEIADIQKWCVVGDKGKVSGASITIQRGTEQFDLTLSKGDWLVVDPGQLYSVITDMELRKRFEGVLH